MSFAIELLAGESRKFIFATLKALCWNSLLKEAAPIQRILNHLQRYFHFNHVSAIPGVVKEQGMDLIDLRQILREMAGADFWPQRPLQPLNSLGDQFDDMLFRF